MEIQQIIEILRSVLTNITVTPEQKVAIEYAIERLSTSNTKQTILEVGKILVGLINAGVKLFDS